MNLGDPSAAHNERRRGTQQGRQRQHQLDPATGINPQRAAEQRAPRADLRRYPFEPLPSSIEPIEDRHPNRESLSTRAAEADHVSRWIVHVFSVTTPYFAGCRSFERPDGRNTRVDPTDGAGSTHEGRWHPAPSGRRGGFLAKKRADLLYGYSSIVVGGSVSDPPDGGSPGTMVPAIG